jgi:hypothetical protein
MCCARLKNERYTSVKKEKEYQQIISSLIMKMPDRIPLSTVRIHTLKDDIDQEHTAIVTPVEQNRPNNARSLAQVENFLSLIYNYEFI